MLTPVHPLATASSQPLSNFWILRYLGAIAFTFSMNAACSLSLSFGGGVVRVATGTPTSTKNFSCPAGEQIQSMVRLTGSVVKLMRSVGRDVQRLAGAEARLGAAESGFHLAFEQDKGFLEIMAVRWRTAAGR